MGSQWMAMAGAVRSMSVWLRPQIEFAFAIDDASATILRPFLVKDLFVNKAATTMTWYEPAIWFPCDLEAGELGFATAFNIKELRRAIIEASRLSKSFQGGCPNHQNIAAADGGGRQPARAVAIKHACQSHVGNEPS